MRRAKFLRAALATLLVAGIATVSMALPASAFVKVGVGGDQSGGGSGAGGGKATPTLTTYPTLGPVSIGTSLQDTAELSNTLNLDGSGTIVIDLYGPSDPTCTSTPLDSETFGGITNDDAVSTSGYDALAAGTYNFVTSFSGDSNNDGVSDMCGDDQVVVEQATPTVSTQLVELNDEYQAAGDWTGNEVTGASISDTVTVTGIDGVAPTGNVNINFYTNGDCSGGSFSTVGTSLAVGAEEGWPGVGNLTAGSFSFQVDYLGDTNYVETKGGCDSFTVNKATPSISTQVLDVNSSGSADGDWTGSEVSPANATDSVTVSGLHVPAPTGTVGIDYYEGGDCASAEIVGASAGISLADAQSGDWGYIGGILSGTYSFLATYSGDSNYNAVTGQCESFSVIKASASLSSTPNVTTVNLGPTTPPVLTDTATLSGGNNPTGSITFALTDVSTNTVVDTETVTGVSGDGTYTTPSGYTLPATAATGMYQWNVSYSGDTSNASVSDVGDPAEQVTVNKSGTSISSKPNVTTVNLGSSTPPVLTDTATLSGGYDPTGTITFTLINTTTGMIVNEEAVTDVNGNGSYATPTGYTLPTALTPPVPGLYQWNVGYSGDSDNLQTLDVGDPAEQVTVNDANPSLNSSPSPSTYTLGTSSGPLKDTVVISNGYNPQGTLTFTLLYNGIAVDSETVPDVNGNGSYTTPTGYTLPATGTVTGTYQWNVQYSGDTNNASAQEANNANEQVAVKGHPETTTTSMNIAKGTLTYGAEAVQTINGVVTGQKNDGAPVGTVNVTYGASATPLCSATLVPGTGTSDTSTYKCALSSNTQLGVANYLTVRATFVPAGVSSTNPNYAYTTSMSGPFSGDNFLVKKDSTTTKVSVSPSSVTVGAESSAIFSVTVTAGDGEAVPNGETVSVKVGSASCAVTLGAGKGSCFIANSALAVGSYSLSATYAGDANLSNSSASGPQLTVKKK